MRKPLRFIAMASGLSLLVSGLVAAAPKEGATERVYLVSVSEGKHAAKLMAKEGFRLEADFSDLGNVVAVRTDAKGLRRLQHMPGVDSVDEEQVYHKLDSYSDSLPITWGLDAVNAQEAWNMGYKGQSIKVCVLDTGIDYSHPEFYRNGVSIIKGSKNFIKDRHPDATDGDGHGTHVAGTIAAQGHSVWGVAPDVELYIGRVLDDQGQGSSTSVIQGVKWCSDTVGAHIISMSLGGGRYSKSEEKTYTSVFNKGRLVIAAAGNDGNNTVSYPAGYTNVVSVAAVNSSLSRADFSQFNSDVELAGPGVGVYSSLPPFAGHLDYTSEDGTPYASNAVEFAARASAAGPLVECGLADTPTSCSGAPAAGDWIALVSRGSISFADKATNVMAQGAAGMIITNNDTTNPDDMGSFTFGAAGNWLVATSVSYNAGQGIRAGGLGNGSVEILPFNYGYYGGTSMATPHVSAVAALVWSSQPDLSSSDLRAVLQESAMDLGAGGRDDEFGHGMVQADAAIAMAAGQ